jgi:hypothetical protein
VKRRNVLVYLSGKMTDPDPKMQAVHVLWAKAMAAVLWNMGFTVICPHANGPTEVNGCFCSYEDYLEGDLVILSRCDCIFMMRGWEESGGAKIECEFAFKNMLPIFKDIPSLIDFAERM